MLRVMLVDNDLKRSKSLEPSLLDNGFDVVAHVESNVNLQSTYRELMPDVVVIDTASPTREELGHVSIMTQHNARPIVMFSKDGKTELIKAATKAGVSGYVVGPINSERLTPVIEAAIARFEEKKQLHDALLDANAKLEERKVVERAKGILMQQRNLGESEAYSLLRSMAMQKNMKLADLSNQLLNVAKMLTI